MIKTGVIRGPLITEKLDKAREKFRQYSFIVDMKATKHDVVRAVEELFKVHVEGVRTNVARGKVKRVGRSMGKRPNYKKAIVTLKEGDKIDLFEGGAV
ncbi:MAG TPA: 50S ribosomal protein L23 [Myxococcaceae bacterium]|jgi:large subunit ribosomal protein L23|nr:50S ribosomal protein L23 [Myxococcaceae bacterium]